MKKLSTFLISLVVLCSIFASLTIIIHNINTRNFIIISFISVLISRLVPHPPNFTSAIAVGFYLPALFGYKYILVALTAFILSDLIIGGHNLLLFTWGSIILIGLLSKYFNNPYFIIFISD